MPRECPCRSATNQSALDGSNANGEQRRNGMCDQEVIGKGIAGELQGLEKLDREHYFRFLDRGTGGANPLDHPLGCRNR